MKTSTAFWLRHIWQGILVLLMCWIPLATMGQQNIIVNLTPIDGIAITPDNIFNYQMQCTGSGNVMVRGVIRYRNSALNISYTYKTTLNQGLNVIGLDLVHPQWQFSSGALKELFLTYKMLPVGTFEYCVSVTPEIIKENNNGLFEECLFYKSEDVFMINLVDPDDKSKLSEFNPMFTWFANYSLSNNLAYRIRIADIKQGQNPVNAVMRNPAMYDESNLYQSSLLYPITAKPLVVNQPYAWTVDAYYKGILLGGSETWQFIIVDSIPKIRKENRSYVDIKRELGANNLTAIGTLKIKYMLEDKLCDSLSLEIVNNEGKIYPLENNVLSSVYGDNRYEIDLVGNSDLKHNGNYIVKIKTGSNKEYKLPFKYINPEFLR